MRSLIVPGCCLLLGAVAAPGVAGAQADPFTLRPTKGPYKTAEVAGHSIPANSPRKPEEAVFRSTTSGFFEALVLGFPGGIGTDSYLGLRSERGWFYVETWYTKLRGQTAEKVTCAPEKATPPGGWSLLRCTVSQTARTPLPPPARCDSAAEVIKQELAFFCAVAPGGIPACTQPIFVAERREETGCGRPSSVKSDWRLNARWSGDTLTVTLDAAHKQGFAEASRELLGKHAVRLPE
jgi:hypothetical protein